MSGLAMPPAWLRISGGNAQPLISPDRKML
jgi:hypothetical protein